MKQIFWDRAEDARKLGSVAIACFAIVIWIGAKACFAFFEEAIFYSLQEWLLSRNQRGQPRRARFKYPAVARPDDVAQHADFAEFLKVRKHIRVVLGMKIGNGKGKS